MCCLSFPSKEVRHWYSFQIRTKHPDPIWPLWDAKDSHHSSQRVEEVDPNGTAIILADWDSRGIVVKTDSGVHH